MQIITNSFLIIILLLIGLKVQAQQNITLIQNSHNGKFNYGYYKIDLGDNNQTNFQIQVIYKSQQYIYTPVSDTIRINTVEAFNGLKKDLIHSIALLNDGEKTFDLKTPQYHIYKHVDVMNGNTIGFKNATGTIYNTLKKFEATLLLEWLQKIEFGKE